jgi:hypothetical protein
MFYMIIIPNMAKDSYSILSYTVKKAKRDAGAQHAGDGKFRHPR